MKVELDTVSRWLGLPPEDYPAAATVTGWSIDSRTVQPGDLFFALKGPHHDGHAYVAEVFRKGAAAVVVEGEAADREGVGAEPAGAILRVRDTLAALQELAHQARRAWGGQVVAVTGSAGKTSTKEIIADLVSEGVPTTRSEGNLNNHVGLPLSLLRLDERARVAVVEMGMNHAGEIRALARIAEPETGVVTNVGWAHVESFNSIEGVAAAKRELIEELPESGTAVLNADDPRVAEFREVYPGRSLLYGQSPQAEVRAEDVRYSLDGANFRVGSTRFESALSGAHNVSNILAGIAVAGLFGIAPDRLGDRVRALRPRKMRGERFNHHGILVFDDCYNSNPDAVRVMLDLLGDTPARRRVAVLGEMLELGRWSEPLHREIGGYAVGRGIDALVGIGGAASYMIDSARRAGLPPEAAAFLEDPAEAGVLARSLASAGDAILFKGSRGIHVEKALERFLAAPEGSPA